MASNSLNGGSGVAGKQNYTKYGHKSRLVHKMMWRRRLVEADVAAFLHCIYNLHRAPSRIPRVGVE